MPASCDSDASDLSMRTPTQRPLSDSRLSLVFLGHRVHAQDRDTCLRALELNHDNLNARMETFKSGISGICWEMKEVSQQVSNNVA